MKPSGVGGAGLLHPRSAGVRNNEAELTAAHKTNAAVCKTAWIGLLRRKSHLFKRKNQANGRISCFYCSAVKSTEYYSTKNTLCWTLLCRVTECFERAKQQAQCSKYSVYRRRFVITIVIMTMLKTKILSDSRDRQLLKKTAAMQRQKEHKLLKLSAGVKSKHLLVTVVQCWRKHGQTRGDIYSRRGWCPRLPHNQQQLHNNRQIQTSNRPVCPQTHHSRMEASADA